MKILVTDATGTVGRHLVNELIQAGHRVRALTRNPAKANLPDRGGHFAVMETPDLLIGDIRAFFHNLKAKN